MLPARPAIAETKRVLDIPRLKRIPLSRYPRGQRFLGTVGLLPNFRFPPRVQIDIDGIERIPNTPVIFAMNHTDRYNYWPFQFALWKQANRFTSTWVKGKYYENRFIGKFMEVMMNLPTVSRGYIITRDFLSLMGRTPSTDEYKALRSWVDGVAAGGAVAPPILGQELEKRLLREPRDVLGYAFDPEKESYPDYINSIFAEMMGLFVGLNRDALDIGVDLLIFPQGTRSIRLLPGHIGLAELALKFQVPVVPVGCNGSDLCYPGSNPIAKGGHIVYRVGEAISYKEMEVFHLPDDFVPFDSRHENTHREKLQGYIDVVMERINELVDPQYQFGGEESEVETGSGRFV
ncbi:MAG: 1-acyl-sn-glycerol-3-phosphate acyltransferase [Myxococcota bacterium]|jgi:1-acyl-sn-glycerol-3-phosphate acyltransferase